MMATRPVFSLTSVSAREAWAVAVDGKISTVTSTQVINYDRKEACAFRSSRLCTTLIGLDCEGKPLCIASGYGMGC